MRFNTSRVPEVFYRRSDVEPVVVYPGFCFDEEILNIPSLPCIKDGVRLERYLEENPEGTVLFYRTFALGDILVLTPIFNDLKSKYPRAKIILATASRYKEIFKYWDILKVVLASGVDSQTYDIGYMLDFIVEKDHRGDRFSYMHRLDIYCEHIGWPVPKDPIFSLPYGEEEKEWAEKVVGGLRHSGKPVLVMQAFGAMWFNRFPKEKVERIASETAKVCSVVLVYDYKIDFEIEGVLNLTGRTTVHQLAALIDHADIVMTMDSGILWVAHCTKTPIIVMFGHTRAREKMAHHRNYYAIDLAKMVGCQSCFGRRTRCSGEVFCLNNSDTQEIIDEIKKGIERLVE